MAKQEDKTKDTISDGPKAKEDTGVKVVNVPLSASNALSPEAGIQVLAPEDSTKEVEQTDAYDPQKTRIQNVVDEDAKVSTSVSKKKYDQLVEVFKNVLNNHIMDPSQKSYYLTNAGITAGGEDPNPKAEEINLG